MNGGSAVADKNPYEEIPIFSQLNRESLTRLHDLFTKITKKKNFTIIKYKEPVAGIYIVVSGEVSVILPEYEKPIATLGPGSCFGEMSLVEKGESASATVQVSSGKAEFLYCEMAKLEQQIEKDTIFANGFYKSAAHLMSSRLRQSNDKINNEIARGVISAAELIETLELDSKIQQTSGRLDDAGENIVTKLTLALSTIREMIETGKVSKDKLVEVGDLIEEVYYGEFQNFDRLSQEMQLIQQYFDNLKRMIDGNRQLAVRGDSDLFYRGPSELLKPKTE